MANNSSPDYKSLFYEAEEKRRRAEDGQRRAEARTQRTTFREFVQACHELLSRPLNAGTPTKSTKGQIPAPTGKYCPTRLAFWSDCPAQQQEIYDAVYAYLRPTEIDAARLFAPLAELDGLSRRISRRVIRSEKDLESYERYAVEDHVHDVIAELCKIPEAQKRFRLGSGVTFDNHSNVLEESEEDDEVVNSSGVQHPRPDQFCIHRVDDDTNTLLMTVEYKPPHKLTVKNLRVGLRPMDFWKEVVNQESIPIDKDEKLTYNATLLTGSTLVQEYHVMIQEGLEYSYITNGLFLVLLCIPYNDPSTLYYYPCEPNMDVNPKDPKAFQQPITAVARVLCLCLMSFDSRIRDQAWRHAARSQLQIWKTSFDYMRAQIPDEELQQAPPNSEYTSSEYTSSEYIPSSPLQPAAEQASRISTRSQGGCAPLSTLNQREGTDSSDSDSGPATQSRKRAFSQVTSSPSAQRSSTQPTNPSTPDRQRQQHTTRFCTQKCLLGLQLGGMLDDHCPNVRHHKSRQGNRHQISVQQLVQLLQAQLYEDLDHNCTPFSSCGSYGAPFKITCAAYGYTVVGKGTTSRLWKEVSRETEIYQVLQKEQGSTVPVFLGTIDLKKGYWLHGAGEIRHMLLMAWGGEVLEKTQRLALRHEISRSKEKISKLGVIHQDLRFDNMLWNEELGRVVIIDFHRSRIDPRLDPRSTGKQARSSKRALDQEINTSKRPRYTAIAS
jgi:hypothetical protein